jgi:CRP-like cAMP-binding protein
VGDHFGDIGVFPELCPVRTSSVRAKTDMEALELGVQDLHTKIKPYFPDFFQALKDLASTHTFSKSTLYIESVIRDIVHAPGH